MKTSDLTDSAEVLNALQSLEDATVELNRLKPLMGKAYVVIEHDADRRKMALSDAVTPFLDKDMAGNKADHYGRASYNYKEACKRLDAELEAAADIKFRYESAKINVEVARSRVSTEKELAAMK